MVSRKSCPQCKENGLSKQTMKKAKFVSRIVNNFRVKCSLGCPWKGSLSDLDLHLKNSCPNYQMKCKHCNHYMTRLVLLIAHTNCSQEKIECKNCELKILKNNMNQHINNVCSQKWLLDKGTMTIEKRKIIAQALKLESEYKSNGNNNGNSNFLARIRDKLNEKGMTTIVVIGIYFAFDCHFGPIEWSQWKFNEVRIFA